MQVLVGSLVMKQISHRLTSTHYSEDSPYHDNENMLDVNYPTIPKCVKGKPMSKIVHVYLFSEGVQVKL